MNNLNRRFSIHILILISLIGCNSSEYTIDKGMDYIFKTGHPEIRLSTNGIISENDTPIISTSIEFIRNSFIYKSINSKKFAEIYYEIKIINKDANLVQGKSDTIKIEYLQNKSNYSENYYLKNDFISEPGNYEVHVTVTDLSSSKDIFLTNNLYLPDPKNISINITSISLSGKNIESLNDEFYPISTYDIPGKVDSLNFEFQIVNNSNKSPSLLEIKLYKFRSDSLPARSMSSNYQTRSRIERKGIDYRYFETITSSTRYLTQNGSIYIEFTYPQMERGNYRIEALLTNDGGKELKMSRDFSIKSENYPYLLSVKELAEPLIYLMNENDHKTLLLEIDEKILKQKMDKFWLNNIKNPIIASKVIQKFYERVEEANKLFSNYKEGWKTDVGKIYILFGYPWYIDKQVRNMRWSYSYNINDFETNFIFTLAERKNKYFPFDIYLLNRNSNYYTIEYMQTQYWLNGLILTNNL